MIKLELSLGKLLKLMAMTTIPIAGAAFWAGGCVREIMFENKVKEFCHKYEIHEKVEKES
jgi:hypothetical protein